MAVVQDNSKRLALLAALVAVVDLTLQQVRLVGLEPQTKVTPVEQVLVITELMVMLAEAAVVLVQ